MPSDVESDGLPSNVDDSESDDSGSEADPDMPPLVDIEDPGELLPPNVDESGDDAEVPPPPRPTHARTSGSWKCGCKLKCHSKFPCEHIHQLRFQHKDMPDVDRKKAVFVLVQMQVCVKNKEKQ